MASESRTWSQLREHYLIEKELADRLRAAPQAVRRQLYGVVYKERARRIPHHPLVVRAADPDAQARAIKPQARLLKHFVNPATTFLEIGPGDCALSLEMAKWVKQVYAVDVADELAKNIMPPANFEFRLFDGLTLPLPQASIDFAYSNDVLEHLHPEDAQAQLTNILNTLKPRGSYFCVTPNRLSGPHDISRHFDRVATGLHLKEYTIGELAGLFRSVGFARVRAVVSVHGRVIVPPLGIQPYTMLEKIVHGIPYPPRQRIASVLTAVKVIATR